MSGFGAKLLAEVVRHGWAGNSPAAVVIALVVMLGVGVPLLVAMLFWLRRELRNRRDLARCPQIPPAARQPS